jgi:hypothetical protein
MAEVEDHQYPWLMAMAMAMTIMAPTEGGIQLMATPLVVYTCGAWVGALGAEAASYLAEAAELHSCKVCRVDSLERAAACRWEPR